MTIKELMIGDRVNKISPSGIVIPIKVTLQELVDMENPIELGKYVWKPIPLTEKILKANGFLKFDSIWQSPKINLSLLHLEEMSPKWFRVEGTLMEIMYVHELQHALRLYDLGELADNFKVE